MKEEPEELKVWKRSPNIAGLPPRNTFESLKEESLKEEEKEEEKNNANSR